MVKEGTFRADLLDRLAFDVVQLPPLRERQSDIMLMAEHLLFRCVVNYVCPYSRFTDRAKNVVALRLAG